MDGLRENKKFKKESKKFLTKEGEGGILSKLSARAAENTLPSELSAKTNRKDLKKVLDKAAER